MDSVKYNAECECAAKVWGVRPEIHPEDFIFHFLLDHPNFGPKGKAAEEYFNNGADSAKKLSNLLTEACGYHGKEIDLLEFASGYGCVSRHIIKNLPFCKLTSNDIHEKAVAFLNDKIKVNAVMSKSVPEQLIFDQSFDVVFALSFFSHMPKSTFSRWFRQLASFVKSGGYLIFTTHGMVSRKECFDDCKLDKDGFYFHPSSEQKDLSKNEYGNAVVRPQYVFDLINNTPSLSLKVFHEAYWWGHQDLYVIKVLSEQINASGDSNIVQRVKRLFK